MSESMLHWNGQSTTEYGMQTVISPEKHGCVYTHINRLNLQAGTSYTLETTTFEMCVSLIHGHAILEHNRSNRTMQDLDCAYFVSNNTFTLTAQVDCTFYIAFAKCEGLGENTFIPYEQDKEIGRFHVVHGEGVSRREVYFMVDDQTPASRLMCGYTFGADGGWTSWPPHEHAATLEETYCYFNISQQQLGYQLTYIEDGGLPTATFHPVQEGNMVVFPKGYHPSVATPGTRNIYFWVLVAIEPELRKYGVVNIDPTYT